MIRPDISAKMPLDDVLLPKHITDTCYASLKQIYADIFKEPLDSNRRMKSSLLKRAVTNKTKSFSPDKAEKIKDPIVTTMVQYSHKESGRSLETLRKIQKYRANWHAGQTDQIRDFTSFHFSTKF